MNYVNLAKLQKKLKEHEVVRSLARLELAALEREILSAFKDETLTNKERKKLVIMKKKINESARNGIETDTQLWNIRKKLKTMNKVAGE